LLGQPRPRPRADRRYDHSAVLGDDGVEAGQVAGDRAEIGQPATSDEDDSNASLTHVSNRLPHGLSEHSVNGDRAVVVNC
jgi:hypothetical protein